jgi:hypothetical protein
MRETAKADSRRSRTPLRRPAEVIWKSTEISRRHERIHWKRVEGDEDR